MKRRRIKWWTAWLFRHLGELRVDPVQQFDAKMLQLVRKQLGKEEMLEAPLLNLQKRTPWRPSKPRFSEEGRRIYEELYPGRLK